MAVGLDMSLDYPDSQYDVVTGEEDGTPFSWLLDVRGWVQEFFGFEERAPYQPYAVPVGRAQTDIERYLPILLVGAFLFMVFMVIPR